MYLFKVGNINGGRVMFDASCHGNERAGSELLYLYAEWLLKSNTPEAKRILERNLTLLVPIVNVDGFPNHRKNMDFEPPRVDGVDLNRNFDWNWDGTATTGGGVSDDPTSYVYRGPYPLSEPECVVYKTLWDKYRPKHYLNGHTGGPRQIWYVRWPTPEDKEYVQQVYSKYEALAESLGYPVYPVSEDGGTGNFNSTPYHQYHIYGWSNEFHEQVGANPPYEQLPDLLETWLPFFIILSQESEVPLPPPPPPPPPQLTGPLGIWTFPIITWASTLFPNIKTKAETILSEIKRRWRLSRL
jgi:hypothetical protein